MLWVLLLTTAASSSLAADENCMSAATCSGDDKSSMLQTHTNVAPQLGQLEELEELQELEVVRASKPAVTSPPCGFESEPVDGLKETVPTEGTYKAPSSLSHCGTWRNSKKDFFDWTRKSGESATRRTGPSGAHSGNHYLYIEASNQHKGAFAILKSWKTTFGAGAWLSFQYHMYGARIGTLDVVFAESARKVYPLWTKTSDKGNKWHFADIDLSSIAGKTGEIWLVATLVKTCAQYLGDIAIDEVSLTTGTPPAPAGTTAPTQMGTQWERNMDADANGKWDFDEFKKALAAGVISIPSTKKAPTAPTSAPTSPTKPPGFQGRAADPIFSRIDKNDNNAISEDEFNKAIAVGTITTKS